MGRWWVKDAQSIPNYPDCQPAPLLRGQLATEPVRTRTKSMTIRRLRKGVSSRSTGKRSGNVARTVGNRADKNRALFGKWQLLQLSLTPFFKWI